MLLDEFVRSSRWGTAQFAGGFLHCGLDGTILLLRRLLARNLMLAYPRAELVLFLPESARDNALHPASEVTFDIRRPRSASLSLPASSCATFKEMSKLMGESQETLTLPWPVPRLHRGS